MTIQEAETQSPAVGGPAVDLDQAVEAVCDRIPPFWPLDAMVATNPYLGFGDWAFGQAAEYQLRVLGRPMTMDRPWLARQLGNGRITDADLAEAAARMGSDLEPAEVRAAAAHPAPPAARFLLYSDLLDERYRPRYSRYVIQQISSFCAAYYDLGQAQWPMPRFGDSLYGAWLAYTRIDRTPGEMEIRTAESLAKLPGSPREAIRFVLERCGVPADRVEELLYLALTRVGGWASYLRHLRWEAELVGERSDDIVDLLAIRVAWEFILLDTCDRPARTYLWLRSLHCLPRQLRPDQQRALEVDCLLQRAFEIAYQRGLVDGLRASPDRAGEAPAGVARPLAQAAFCIDVRSEVFRRSLETVTGEVQTQGFAGFFGVMAEYQPLGAGRAHSHLPVLLPARYRVCEAAAGGDAEATESLFSRRRAALALSKAWKQFKLSSASCFSFVESAGLMYAPKLITDHLGLTRPVPHPEAKGLTREQVAGLAPDLDGQACAGAEGDGLTAGIPAADRPQVAAFILNAMGLTEGFGRLVMLAGHGSSTVNNPHRAGLDCGACAGQTGEASVRIACALLNDPEVRAALASDHGVEIAADTWFLPALHDTTTDEVALLDTARLPAERQQDLTRLRGFLQRAGDLARSERLGLLQEQSPESADDALKAVRRRGSDWAQVRPEWGLAGNAAFIAAPRWRTAHLDLDGRAFLHEYDWRADDGFEVLNLIMTAPMVVANWINLQYYGSTVDPEHLSAGSKVLHNVVGGRLGVLEGNGGDLRVGLAKQSLHDGRDWVHEPLRLSVFIEAPQAEMDRIIGDHQTVRNLVANEWLHLFQIAEDGEVSRRRPEGGWEPAPGLTEPAATG